MKLTKRLLSTLLVLCMVLSMLPAMGLTASAAIDASATWTETAWANIPNGATIIVANTNNVALPSTTATRSPTKVSITVSGSAGALTITPASGTLDDLVWTVNGNTTSSDGVQLLQYGSTTVNLCLSATNSTTAVRVSNSTSNNKWVMGNSGKLLKVQNATRYLGEYVSGSDWRSYDSETASNYKNQSLKFYVLNSSAASYTVTASASPAAGGTVTVEGNTITATPNDGYYVTGEYVADDGIEVTYNNDNTFTFSATKDGEVLIEFAAKTAATLTYSENGATHNASGSYYVGDSVTLDKPVNAAPATYTFVGWLPSTYATNDTAPANLLKVGDSYTLSAADNTLYAVYAIAGEGGGSSDKFTITTSLTPGNYVFGAVMANANASLANNTKFGAIGFTNTYNDKTNNWGKPYTEMTPDADGSVTVTDSSYIWTLVSGNASDGYVFKRDKSYLYLGTSAGSTSVGAQAGVSDTEGRVYIENVSSTCKDAFLLHPTSSSTNVLLLNTGSAGYRMYAPRSYSATMTPYIRFYKADAGTAYTGYTTTVNTAATYYTLTYSANPVAGGSITCDSASGASIAENDLVELSAVAAEHYTFSGWTVTGIGAADYVAEGNRLLVTMSNDVTVVANFTAEATYTVTINQVTGGTMEASKVSGIFAGETIILTATPNAHYSFGGWQVVSGGASITGNSFTMPAANVVITGSFVEDAQYTVTYYDKDGSVCATKTYYDGETILVSDVPSVVAPDGFVFKNWYSTTYNGTDAPAYTAPAGTTVNGNLEFHAVYAELGEGGSSDSFTLVTNNSQLVAGNQYLLGYASNRTDGTINIAAPVGTDTFLNRVTETAASGVIALSADSTAQIFTLGGSEGAWTLTGATDGMLGASSSNAINTNANNNTTWNITVASSGAATIASVGLSGRYLQYNSTSPRFACYNGNQQTPSLYVCGASISGYTTNPVSTKITVTWMNGTDVFKTEKVAYGDEIVAPDTNPEKTEEEQQYYTFAGWSEDGSTVITTFPTASAELGDKTYYAVYTTVSKLTVTWNNYDGTTLATEYYKAGETPSYKDSDPTKPADSSFYYTFSGWDPTVSSINSSITYTATFTQHDRFELTASLSKDTVKVDRFAQVNYTLTDMGTETTAFTPTFSVGNSTIASVDANGKITAKAVGSTTVTITFAGALDAKGNPISKTMNLVVIENTSSGGYTLITQDNAPTDWSGDYIIMGKIAGDTTYMNTWMILTPDYDTGTAKIATNNEDAATITITDDGSGIGTGTINDEGNASSGVDKTIVMEDTGLVTDTNDDDSILVYDTITEIDDAYAFTIECIDDINQIYTIRVKDTDLYIACSKIESAGSGTNSLNFDSSATEYAQWKFSVQRVTKGGYNNDIITAQNVGNTTRRLYFNNNSYAATTGQFRDYNEGAFSGKIGTPNAGQSYSLYLFGNPNPFKAQIYYHGDQITLADTGKINANATTAQLVGALTPDIDGYPNWTLVGDPKWEIVENSTGNNMTVDSATGLITTNASTVDSYALVKVTYTIHDEINNVNQLVSTTAKVEVIAADTTYSTVIYETYSGTDTEVQYTVPNSMTTLPLAAYVVNDTTNDNSKTGSVVMGGTLTWKAVISSGGGKNATVSIDSDGTLHMANFASDAIITVTVSGATGDSIAASSATYKVYVKTAEYTLTVVPTMDSQGTYDPASDVLTVSGSESSAHLTYNVVDDNGNGPSSKTFTLAGYAWTLSGDTYRATINSSGYLDFTGMDRSEDRTITAVVSRVAATDVASGVTKSNLTDTITIVVKAQTVEEVLEAVNDTVIIDWALPVTFNVLTNDNYNVTVSVVAGTLPTGVSANGDGTFTYTPSGWQTTDQTFTYTLSGTVNGAATSSEATVTLKTADSIYYEDTYSGIFTFSGNWVNVTDGTLVAEQTSSLDTADAFEYDANHAEYAMYSGGTAKMTTLVKGDKPSVTFSFAGTGFDIISATTNNTGAIMLTVKDAGGAVVTDPNTGKKLSQIIDIFRGYTYVKEGYTRYGLKEVTRYKLEGESYILDAAGNYYYDSELKQFVENTVWYTPTENMSDKYYDSANQFDSMQDENGTYVLKEYTSNWLPNTGENSDGNYYQIPILKVTDLPYGTYTVTVKPVYSAAYDRQGDGSYDFIFDGVRIHNPVVGREAEYKYISLSDAVKEAGFGSGTVVACDHVGQEWSDWTFYSRARNTTSATTCNRGSFVQYCNYCGGVANTAYFHVNITADATELGVGGYNSLPSTTMLHYTLTADECGDAAVQASIQAKLDAINGTLTEYWSSNTRDIMTCMNNSNVVIANGSGTTYATLQLKDPATQTIYASAIHSPMITVSADETHTHTFGDWVHDANSSPSTHTHTCTAETCSYYETEACVFTSEVTTQPTQTTEGVRTYTCTGCDYSYTKSADYAVRYIMQEGVTYSGNSRDGNNITLPTAVSIPSAYNAQTYTLVGWATETSADSETAPSYYAPGAVVTIQDDAVFYPLYSYGGSGGGANRFELVDTLTSGKDYVFVTTNSAGSAYALDASNLNAPAHNVSGTAVTVNSGSTNYVETSDSALIFTVTEDGTMGSYTKYKMTATVDGSERNLTINGNGIGYQASYKAGFDGSNGLFGTNSKNTTCYYVYETSAGKLDAASSHSGRMYAYERAASGSGATTYTFTLQAATQTDNYTLTLTPAKLTMPLNFTASLTAVLKNNGVTVTAESIEFSSDNPAVVTVDSTSGTLYSGSTAGTATITVDVMAADAEIYTAYCNVTVTDQSAAVTVNYIGSETGRVYNWGTSVDKPAVRSIPTGDFTGAVIIDGMGPSNVADDFAAYGPNYGVYLAPGQGIVFSLASDVTNITTQDLQIGAKAVNGTATQMDVAAISNGIKYLLQDQAIASATEMYYELDGSQVGWSNGNSSIIVIYNSGSGVLDVTNIRYSTANGNTLTLTINDTQTKNAVKMLGIVYGTEITVADPNNVEPIDPTTESSAEPTTEPTTEPEPDPITIDRFTDIEKDAWYIDGVKYAIDNGLMNGVSMTEFAPEETLTRAMLVTILYRLAGEPETSTKTNFTDVPEGEWYSDAVAWTVEKGVTLGTSETTFDPSQPVTREQLVTFLWRYAGKPESKQSLSAFADNAMVSEYAYTAMQWAVENMIVNGKEDGKLDPVGNATRAEIAIIFMRAEKMLAQPE